MVFNRNSIRDFDANRRWSESVKVGPQHTALWRISPSGEEHRRKDCCADLRQYLKECKTSHTSSCV